MSLRGLFLCLALIILAALVAPRGASAHAALVSSEPATGAVLDKAPPAATLTFSEPVAPLVFRLLGPDGKPADLAGVAAVGSRVTAPLPTDLARGTHVLSWRVVSEDGHPVGGTLVFSVGAASSAANAAYAADRDPVVAAGLWLARLGLYAGLFLGIGGVFFRAFAMIGPLPPGGLRRGLVALLGIGMATALVGLCAQGLDALGLPATGLASASVWQAGLSTSFGRTTILAMLGCALALAALFVSRRPVRRSLAALAMLGPGLALAATGHAAAADPQLLMRPLVFLHASAIAAWAGALLPLAVALAAGGGRAALARFSVAAPAVFALLFASGAAIAVVQLGSVDALWTTGYGRVLAAKLAAVALVLAIAAHNRFALTAPVLRGDGRATRRLVGSIVAEIALVLAIFGLAALWRFTPPPRALDVALPAIEVHLHGEKAMAEVVVTPHRQRDATVEVEPLDGDGVPFRPLEVTLALAPAGGGMEPIRVAATPGADGRWQATMPGLAAGGTWTIRLDLLVSDFEKAQLQGEITLPAP
ncbi:copper resistance protein CopC [Kaistia nematophila]|uniref:Copper resistance protein CopC n=1 Tax=Kaistia nematophila TaxID=2994654 RepID=A0A9X3E464_9HYPH|nr:copper resistance protein CopC [Kaistia nematophila]MCX5570457.1 copper resistance protein CopC [Kaistia nematophila]